MGKSIAEKIRWSMAEGDQDSEPRLPVIGSGFSVPERLISESEFSWFHPPREGTTYLAVRCKEPVWYAGHFHGGRMKPCGGDGCSMCVLGIGRQIRYVISCVDLRTRTVGFLEVGSVPGQVLRDLYNREGSILGAVVALSRTSRAKQSRIELEVLPEKAPAWSDEVHPVSVELALRNTWARGKAKGG